MSESEPEKPAATTRKKAPGKKSGLTAKQVVFVREYMLDGNGTRSAIAAGYAPASAYVTASQLLRNPHVAKALAERRTKAEAKSGVTRDRVLEEYRRIAFAKVSGVLSFGPDGVTVKSSDDLPEDILAAVSEVSEVRNADGSVSVRLKFHGKDAALAGLRKMQGYDAPEEVTLGADDKLQGALGKLAEAMNRKRNRAG